MPLVAQAITSAILAANPSLTGTTWYQITTAIGTAVQTWAVIPTNVVIIGSVTGAVGGGAVMGKFLMSPAPLPVSSAVAAAGLLGVQASPVAQAVGIGIATSFNSSAQYVGTATGAIGADVSKVAFSNAVTLISLINANFTSQNITGALASQLATGLGNGVSTMILTGFGTGTAVGAAGPSPGTGVSRSSLL